jgi:hypothetical protein
MDETYATGVVLGETERKIIEAKAEKLGLGARGFSAALRIIVREWDQLIAQKSDRSYPQPSDWRPESPNPQP